MARRLVVGGIGTSLAVGAMHGCKCRTANDGSGRGCLTSIVFFGGDDDGDVVGFTFVRSLKGILEGVDGASHVLCFGGFGETSLEDGGFVLCF